MKTKTPRAPKPRIESVRIEHKYDESPDTSWLGEYSRQPKDHAIDREARGDMEREEYQFFNPANHHNADEWSHVSDVDVVKTYAKQIQGGHQELSRDAMIEALNAHYREQDYKRMESLQRGDWSLIGIIAKAVIRMTPESPSQVIRSGGLWGIESDSGKDYLAETAREQLQELDLELAALGFTTRQIKHAFGNVQNPD